MIEWLDATIGSHAPLLDFVALAAVLIYFGTFPNWAAFIVAIDFTLVFFGQDYLQSLALWGSLGVDYHYTLALKDTIVCLIILRFSANRVLCGGYGLAALVSASVWASYGMLDYAMFRDVYVLWSPLYFGAMVIQVIGLWCGNVGKCGWRGCLLRNRMAVPDNSYTSVPVHHSKTQSQGKGV